MRRSRLRSYSSIAHVALACLAALLPLLALAWIAPPFARAASPVIYVRAAASGANTGASWADAYTSLQSALAAAASGDEIWVAAGTYTPSAPGDRDASFVLKDGVALFGGFAGAETARSQRSWKANVTTLSGDIGSQGDASDNSYHVVVGATSATLDGFTITGGNADGGTLGPKGAGIYNNAASPTLRNLIVRDNRAGDGGAGIYNNGGSATVTDVTVSGNTAQYGAGLYHENGSTAAYTNVTVSGNIAVFAGSGVYSSFSNPTLTNAVISGNTAGATGGGLLSDGGALTLTNVTISGNTAGATDGGVSGSNGMLMIRNSIIWGNTANGAPSAIGGNSLTAVSYSIVEGGYTGSNNLSADPEFVAAVPAAPSTDGDLHLQANSPGVDAGDNSAVIATTDLAAQPRLADIATVADSGNGSAPIVDMGAYERQPLIYVNAAASGATNGTTWPNAYTSLESALAAAVSGTEIWVAAGTYRPSTSGDRTASFVLKDGVALYGGFAGSETDRSQRSWTTNPTILSGDLAGNDGANFANNTENSYHVVVGATGATLDGFTISGGNADGGALGLKGAGIYNNVASPTLRNLIVRGNIAADGGAGIYNNGGSATVTDVTVSGNSAQYGAGLYHENGSTAAYTNVVIGGNRSSQAGGGVYSSSSSPTLTNVTISGNMGGTRGGGMLSDGGAPALTNVTISGNTVTSQGGVIYIAEGGGVYVQSGSVAVRNSIIWGNTADASPSAIASSGSTTVSSSIVEGGYGSGNLSADPQFVTVVPAAPSTGGDLRLQANSPAIDAGDNSVVVPTTDLAGKPRLVDIPTVADTGSGSAPLVDMGAYERQPLIFVNAAASGANTGESWADAYTSLQSALAAAASGVEIWVAAGTYPPSAASDRTASFVLKDGVAVYGGFAGTEAQLSARDWASNVTTLSGDIGAQGDASDNSYHVVVGATGATLDGFTISGGNAAGSSSNAKGGGIYNKDASPILRNLIVYNNRAAEQGGGIYQSGGSATATDVTIVSNTAQDGGGVYDEAGSTATYTNLTVTGNGASNAGGGIYSSGSSPTVTNAVINSNFTQTLGGGVMSDGGAPTLTNVTVTGNVAYYYGGGIGLASGSLAIRNSIIWHNSHDADWSEIGTTGGTIAVSYSLVQFGYGGVGNIDGDPQFADGLRLQSSSPAIDAGDNSVVIATTDLAGKPRLADMPAVADTGSGSAPLVDMGAYERQPLIYVNAAASGANTGASWADAYTSLQSALTTALSGDQIWVAAGTYRPSTTGERSASFVLKDGVALYGGFDGTETQLNARSWQANPTVLSGDLAGDDGANAANNAENSYHVVVGATGATLDGFTISGGNADGGALGTKGGGIYNNAASPTLRNLIVRDNRAGDGGAGIYNSGGSAAITDVTISGNRAQYGGGVYDEAGSTAAYTNLTVSGNDASNAGGGIYTSDSSPTLTNTIISGNSSGSIGGFNLSLSNGGGLSSNNSSPTLTNVVISGNRTYGTGGGLYHEGGAATLTSVTISGNHGNFNGGGVFLANGNLAIRNSIIWNNTGGVDFSEIFTQNGTITVSYSLVQFGFAGAGNLSVDPKFVAAVPAAPSTGGSLWLQSSSPAIDAGNNSVVVATTDLMGRLRLVNMPDVADIGSGSAPIVDMGAYERQMPILVNAAASGANTGASWADAYTSLQSALMTAIGGDQIWVAAGTYRPSTTGERSASFMLKDGVAIYGGFAGTETQLSQRNWKTNPTILSGDIGTEEDMIDNSYHVVVGATGATLDGFTISGGNAAGGSSNARGGGIYNKDASPTLRNLIVYNNRAADQGGGIYQSGGSATATDVTIVSNTAQDGGGVYDEAGSTATYTNLTVTGNGASNAGGGIYSSGSSPTVTNAVINSNSAITLGGGVMSDGGAPTLTNVTVTGNVAYYGGGGILLANGSLAIRNSIIWHNSYDADWSEIATTGGTIAVSYSLVQFGYGGVGNIDGDPQFADGLRLQSSSPAIDAGDNSVVVATTDLAGNPRRANLAAVPDTGSGSAPVVDMGAYEYEASPGNLSPTLDALVNRTLLEDAGKQTIALSGISAGAGEGSQTVTITASSSNPALIPTPAVSYTSPGATGSLSFTPAANATGTATIIVTVQDGGAGVPAVSVARTFTVQVTPVNDAPSFTVGPNQAVKANAGKQSVAGWATSFTPGPADEASQTLLGYSIVSNSAPELFSIAPALDPSGTLTYTPMPGASGVATIGVVVRDSGGTANGGIDTSAIQTFTIRVTGGLAVYLPLVVR